MNRDIPISKWGSELLPVLEKAKKFVLETKRDLKETEENWGYFEKAWKDYLKVRGIENGNSDKAEFPTPYGVPEREKFYKEVSFDGWGGSSGHDAPMIAYLISFFKYIH